MYNGGLVVLERKMVIEYSLCSIQVSKKFAFSTEGSRFCLTQTEYFRKSLLLLRCCVFFHSGHLILKKKANKKNNKGLSCLDKLKS